MNIQDNSILAIICLFTVFIIPFIFLFLGKNESYEQIEKRLRSRAEKLCTIDELLNLASDLLKEVKLLPLETVYDGNVYKIYHKVINDLNLKSKEMIKSKRENIWE